MQWCCTRIWYNGFHRFAREDSLSIESGASRGAAICERVIQFKEALTPSAARSLLRLQFPPSDIQRMRELSAKARTGKMTKTERAEIEAYEQLGCLLDILHSKARVALKHR
jgi:hypothetical protein